LIALVKEIPMWFRTFFKSLIRHPILRRLPTSRVCLEPLEDRCLPSFSMPIDYGVGLTSEILPSEYDVGLTSKIVASADFNGDGRLDLAATTRDSNTLSVLLGNDDGTFQRPETFSTGIVPRSLAVADLNGDGTLDLVSLNRFDSSVLLGNGDGTFQPPQTVVLPAQFPPGYTNSDPVPQRPTAIAIGDLDGDGHLDLVGGGRTLYSVLIGYDDYGYPSYENHSDGYLNVLLGNGDGTFDTGAASHLGYTPSGLELGDFNGDGRLDVVTSSQGVGPGGRGILSLLLGKGDGTFHVAQHSYGVYLGDTSNPVGDFDRDGNLDLLSGSWNGAVLMRGNGDGTFQPGQDMKLSTQWHSTIVGDVNADGKLDIVVLQYDVQYISYNEYQEPDAFDTIRSALVYLGYGDGSFTLPVAIVLGTVPDVSAFISPVLADFDGDGFLDLAASEWYRTADDFNYYGSGVYRGIHVMRNDGDWTLPPQPPPPPPFITISDVTVTEGNTGTTAAHFTVTLSAESADPVTVTYTTADGSATAGSDYQAVTDTLVFAPGETTKTIPVLVYGDRIAEPNETFCVNLSSPTNATIADGQGIGTIVDDEPRITINNVTKAEGKNRKTTLFTFTVTLSAAYDQAVTMSFKTANGTATTSNNDYVARTGTLTFAPGETSKTITIEVKGDSKREANETFYVDLFGLSGNALFTQNRGTGTILNDD
jgi:hypothetical protein